MKLKYYLRGLGIGIIVTTIILAVSFSKREVEISDEEIIERALQLGMVMQEDMEEPQTETESQTDTELEPQTESQTDTEIEPQAEEQAGTESLAGMEPQAGTQTQPGEEQQAGTQTQSGTEPQTGTQTQPGAGEILSDAAGNDGGQGTAENYRLVIRAGDVCRVICENLEENGVVSDAEALREYLSEAGYASNIRAGEYDIPYGASHEEILQILKAGPLKLNN